jgi:hypothetical protein
MPGVRVNIGSHGAGVSVGPRGVHVGMNRRGMYQSAGIPGTGLYCVHHVRSSTGQPAVAGSAWPLVLLIGLLAFLAFARACA